MTGPGDMPAAEVELDATLVRDLLTEQHPDLAHLDLVEVAEGWDNVLFRLGDELALRLPRRAMGAALVAHEQRWLGVLAPRLPLPIPVPLRVGRPGLGYPWSWSITRWFPGRPAAVTPPGDLAEAAATLGRFLAALHVPAPPDAPANPYRGVPLAERSAVTLERIARLAGHLDAAATEAAWRSALTVPPWSGPPLWLHGDLHPANLVVDGGRLTAVVDFGDITAGDPATDLSVAWMLLPPAHRSAFRRAAGPVDDDTWARARGAALAHALACLASSADNPLMESVGRRTLDAVLADTS